MSLPERLSRRWKLISGNVWIFSDQIEDEDLPFMAHEFVPYGMACDYYRFTHMTYQSGSICKIGKSS